MQIILIVYFMKWIRIFCIENDCDMCNDNNVGGDNQNITFNNIFGAVAGFKII